MNCFGGTLGLYVFRIAFGCSFGCAGSAQGSSGLFPAFKGAAELFLGWSFQWIVKLLLGLSLRWGLWVNLKWLLDRNIPELGSVLRNIVRNVSEMIWEHFKKHPVISYAYLQNGLSLGFGLGICWIWSVGCFQNGPWTHVCMSAASSADTSKGDTLISVWYTHKDVIQW